jgi:hypothetical protein
VRCINYAASRTADDWFSFQEIYRPFRAAYGVFRKPVLISALGCATGPYQKEWLSEALHAMSSEYKEIKGAIVFNGSEVVV